MGYQEAEGATTKWAINKQKVKQLNGQNLLSRSRKSSHQWAIKKQNVQPPIGPSRNRKCNHQMGYQEAESRTTKLAIRKQKVQPPNGPNAIKKQKVQPPNGLSRSRRSNNWMARIGYQEAEGAATNGLSRSRMCNHQSMRVLAWWCEVGWQGMDSKSCIHWWNLLRFDVQSGCRDDEQSVTSSHLCSFCIAKLCFQCWTRTNISS